MSFTESPVFPLCVSFRPIFGPMFSTDIVETDGGQEYRNQNVTQPLQHGRVSFDARKTSDMAIVRQWFYAMRGRWGGFRVRDTSDFTCPDDNGIGGLTGIGGGSPPTIYQMEKWYTRGSVVFKRKILKPEVGATGLYDGNELKLLTTHYMIDESTGQITILFTPNYTLTWRGTFHVPVRFESDVAEIEILDKSPEDDYIQGWQDISLVEIRNPF